MSDSMILLGSVQRPQLQSMLNQHLQKAYQVSSQAESEDALVGRPETPAQEYVVVFLLLLSFSFYLPSFPASLLSFNSFLSSLRFYPSPLPSSLPSFHPFILLPFFLSSFLPSFLRSLPASLPPSLPPFLLSSLLSSFPPSFPPSLPPSFLPSLLPSLPPSFLPSLPPSFYCLLSLYHSS